MEYKYPTNDDGNWDEWFDAIAPNTNWYRGDQWNDDISKRIGNLKGEVNAKREEIGMIARAAEETDAERAATITQLLATGKELQRQLYAAESKQKVLVRNLGLWLAEETALTESEVARFCVAHGLRVPDPTYVVSISFNFQASSGEEATEIGEIIVEAIESNDDLVEIESTINSVTEIQW